MALLSTQLLIEDFKRKQLELAMATFKTPPGDHAGFMQAVGRFRGLEDAIAVMVDAERRSRHEEDEPEHPERRPASRG